MRAVLGLLLATAVVVAALGALVWPRDDAPRGPDAVVVLGGAGDERARLGIEVADDHDALLVLSSSAQHFAAQQGVSCDDQGVRCFEPDPPNTIGEARNVADLAAAAGWGHVTVVTSRFHTSRARVAFRQCLDEVSVVGATRPDRPALQPRRELREALGTLAAHTFRRAC